MKIGIDVGGSHIASGIVDENGKLVDKESRDLELAELGSEERATELILSQINYEISVLLKRNGFEIGDISKIGLAAGALNKIYNTKISLHNDGKCAGMAEKKFGALKLYSDCIFLCIGTGVGSAVFMDGDLLVPKNAVGFELGHMIIDKSSSNKCNCGNNGCFETFASMKRFKKNAIKELKLEKDYLSEEVQNYIRTNIDNVDVQNFLNEYLDNVAVGISNLINIFEPEAIAFGGSFSYYADIFLPILKLKVEKYKFNKETKTALLEAKLKNDAGIIGAALM